MTTEVGPNLTPGHRIGSRAPSFLPLFVQTLSLAGQGQPSKAFPEKPCTGHASSRRGFDPGTGLETQISGPHPKP